MTPDQLKGMNGRRVLVEGVLEYLAAEGGFSYVQFDPQDPDELSRCQVHASAIREILPEPIKAGDVVKTGGGSVVTVLSIAEDGEPVALIKYGDGSYDGRPLSDLTLMEQGQ